MQRSDEASWAPSTRPKRQLRQPSYLKDYEVSAVRPKIRGPSRASPAPHPPREEDRGSQPHVKWSRPPEAHDNYLPSFEESYDDTSLGWRHTPMPHTEEGAEPSWLHRESMQYGSASPYETRRESLELPASAREARRSAAWSGIRALANASPSITRGLVSARGRGGWWGAAPSAMASSDYPPESAAVEEQRVVIVIDRMMSELQLMRDSMTPSITAHTRPHSTPRSLNAPQPRRGSEQYDGWSPTLRPGPHSPISRPQHSMYHTNAGSSTQHPTRPDMSQPHPARGRQFSSVSASQGGGEYRGPAPKIPLFIHNDPMEFSWLN